MFKYHNFRTFLITPPETSGLYIKTKSGSQKTIIQENKNTHFPEKSQKKHSKPNDTYLKNANYYGWRNFYINT